MQPSFSSVAASIIFSGVGLWLFREGKRRANFTVMTIGMVMMVYTYITSSPWIDWGVGFALCAVARYYWYC